MLLLALTLMPRLRSKKLKNACDRMSLKWLRCRSLLSRDWLNRTHMMLRRTQKKLRSQLPKLVADRS